MIRFRVVSVGGQPATQEIAAEFDETGGTIGRAVNNHLVLPDPERQISRQHATVLFRGGRYIIVDQGSAIPVYVNGRAIGNGKEAPIGDRDEVRVGQYNLEVSAPPGRGPERGFEAGSPIPPDAIPDGEQRGSVDDPLALFGEAASAGSNDPFGDVLKRPPHSAPDGRASLPNQTSEFPSNLPADAPQIPEDFDPFAEKYAAKPLYGEPDTPQRLPDPLDVGFSGQAEGQSIDSLFNLTPQDRPGLLGTGGPLAEPSSQPECLPERDPFAESRMSSPPGLSTGGDHVLELHGSFEPPKPISRTLAGPAGPSQSSERDPMQCPQDDTKLGLSAPISKAVAELSEPTPPPPVKGKAATNRLGGRFADNVGLDAGGVVPPSAAPSPSVSPATSQGGLARLDSRITDRIGTMVGGGTPTAGSSEEALERAFLAGLGTAQLRLADGLTPELMQLVGMLLRESVQGTLDLLLARAMTKRDLRAIVTVMAERDNNPLKFSPNVEVAMTHLLGPQGLGFLTPVEAMRDAYDDLRSHTFGFMAGLRAALAEVFARFDPEQLERRLAEKSMVDSLLSMNRKAKLWDLFRERYKDISEEAQEDFHALFGREFLRVYEEQVARLRDK